MSVYMDRAKKLRADTSVHYNCAQTVVLSFGPESGLNDDALMNITSNFGSGMKRGGTCGAVSAVAMVLGLFGISDQSVLNSYYSEFMINHDNNMDCRDLLRVNAKKGGDRKNHCDGMVFEAVEMAEKILRDYGKIA